MHKSNVNIEKAYTWRKYHEEMCDHCMSFCCRLPTEVTIDDLIHMGALDEFYLGEPIKAVVKHLEKEGVIKYYRHKTELFTLAQNGDKDCVFLDLETRKCSVYDRMPKTCRDYPIVGPRPGFCPYVKKEEDLLVP